MKTQDNTAVLENQNEKVVVLEEGIKNEDGLEMSACIVQCGCNIKR